MDQNKISELVLKLSLSGIPPSLQEYILSNLDKLQEQNVAGMISALDDLAECEGNYMAKAEKYVEFYQKLSEDIHSKLIDEAKEMQEELLLELATKQ